MQAIKITNEAQLKANQQLRAQLAAREQDKKTRLSRRLLNRLVAFLNTPGWELMDDVQQCLHCGRSGQEEVPQCCRHCWPPASQRRGGVVQVAPPARRTGKTNRAGTRPTTLEAIMTTTAQTRTEAAIRTARREITQRGWSVSETRLGNNECHLELTKGSERKGWGVFDRLYCWTEAFEAITGRSWLELKGE